jgi:hypothetical protein
MRAQLKRLITAMAIAVDMQVAAVRFKALTCRRQQLAVAGHISHVQWLPSGLVYITCVSMHSCWQEAGLAN